MNAPQPADEFVERFGVLSPGPRNPSNPADKAVALYDAHTLARRYTFENEPGNAWAIDAKTGERAFRLSSDGRTYLPNGREIATPRAVSRRPVVDPAAKLYAPNANRSPDHVPARRPALDDNQRFADALYGRGR